MFVFLLGNQVAIPDNSGSMGSSLTFERILLMHKQEYVEAVAELAEKFQSIIITTILNRFFISVDANVLDEDRKALGTALFQSVFSHGELSSNARNILKMLDINGFYGENKGSLLDFINWVSPVARVDQNSPPQPFKGIYFSRNVDVIRLSRLHHEIYVLNFMANKFLDTINQPYAHGPVVKIVFETQNETWSVEDINLFFSFFIETSKRMCESVGVEYIEPKIAAVETGSLEFLWVVQDLVSNLYQAGPEAAYYIALVLGAYGGFNKLYVSAQKRNKAISEADKSASQASSAQAKAASAQMDYFIKVKDLARDKTPAEQVQMFNAAVDFLGEDNSPLAQKFKQLAEQIQRQSDISQKIAIEAPKSFPQLFLPSPSHEEVDQDKPKEAEQGE